MVIHAQDLTYHTTDTKKNEREEDDDEAGDDLHAFFNEVEHVAQQVNEVDGEAVEPIVSPTEATTTQNSTNDSESKKRPLEDDVESNSTTEQSTPKKVKATPLPPQVPRGVVVASAAAASSTVASSTNTATMNKSNQQLLYPTPQSDNVTSFHMMPSSNILPVGSSTTLPLQQPYSVGPAFPPSSASTPYTTSATSSSKATVLPTLSSYQLQSQQIGTSPSDVLVTTTTNSGSTSTTNNTKQSKPHIRQVAGKVWVDPTLSDWPDNDFRIFVGNLDPNVTDEQLFQHFSKHYPSLNQVRIVRDKKKNNVSLGYGFVSLLDPLECAKAIREQDQSWLGGRPIRIKRSHWKDRELQERQQKQKHNSSSTISNNRKNKKRR
jgi:hypothetical protein